MARINVTHVLGGGLLAGLVINVLGGFAWEMVLADDFQRQLVAPLPGQIFMASWLWSFAVGVMAVSLYAAIRAHFGSGSKTAIIAGAMTWVLGCALPNGLIWAFGIFEGSLMATSSAVGLVELVLATLAGAWLYRSAGEVVAVESGASA